jgi:O-antigen ligase
MLFQLVPLSPDVVAWLSPERWKAVAGFRELTGRNAGGWISLSVAPPATMERLGIVLPALATFVAAREMAWWWARRLWIAIAPVITIAWLESLLGLAQFYSMRAKGVEVGSASGTYVNRDHFAGLLEMALPVVLTWAVTIWRRNTTRHMQPARIAITTALLAAVSASILIGIVLSLSRMAFVDTLIGLAATFVILIASIGSPNFRWLRWRWAVPITVLILAAFALPTKELIVRFTDLSATSAFTKDERFEIWRDTRQLISAYRWTGCGLGTYEQCLYRYKTTTPINTVNFAHNDYLQVLAELGVIGGAAIASLVGWILWNLVSVILYRKEGRNWELAVGLLVAMLVFSLHSLVDFNLYIPANAAALAWLCGVAASPGLKGF